MVCRIFTTFRIFPLFLFLGAISYNNKLILVCSVYSRLFPGIPFCIWQYPQAQCRLVKQGSPVVEEEQASPVCKEERSLPPSDHEADSTPLVLRLVILERRLQFFVKDSKDEATMMSEDESPQLIWWVEGHLARILGNGRIVGLL
jgi:hypothetical protein